MLKIRRKQMEAFGPIADQALIGNIVEHLRQNHADASVQLPSDTFTVAQVPDETLQEMVRHGITRARNYGMTWESSLGAFVVLLFVVAPNFDEHPIIRRVLRDEMVPPDSRIDQLWERTSEENWEAVEQNYDANAWGLISREA